jgi:hypothetical protein
MTAGLVIGLVGLAFWLGVLLGDRTGYLRGRLHAIRESTEHVDAMLERWRRR